MRRELCLISHLLLLVPELQQLARQRGGSKNGTCRLSCQLLGCNGQENQVSSDVRGVGRVLPVSFQLLLPRWLWLVAATAAERQRAYSQGDVPFLPAA